MSTVLHIEAGRHLYGGALQVIYLIKGLQDKPINNILACTEDSQFAQYAQQQSINCETIPMKGDVDILMIRRLLQLIKKHRPSLVHLHSRRGADLFGAIAGRMAHIPVLLTRRVDNPEHKIVVKAKYTLYQHIITISDGIRNVLLAEGVQADKVTTVHSAVDSDLYQPVQDRQWFLQKFSLAEDSLTLAIVAQLIPRKGHEILLSIMDELCHQFPHLHLLIFGKGPLLSDLQKQIAQLSSKNNIHYCGFVDNLYKVLPNVDVLVHPASMEGLGVSLLQAAACGIPIVAFPSGGIPEIVKHGVNGYLVETGNKKSLQKHLQTLLLEQNLRQQLGRQGRQIIEEEFSIRSMVEGNWQVYGKFL